MVSFRCPNILRERLQDYGYDNDRHLSEFIRMACGMLMQEVFINHNIFTYVMAGIMANEIAFSRPKEAPVKLQVVLQLIESLLKAEKWQMMLHREWPALDRITP